MLVYVTRMPSANLTSMNATMQTLTKVLFSSRRISGKGLQPRVHRYPGSLHNACSGEEGCNVPAGLNYRIAEIYNNPRVRSQSLLGITNYKFRD